MGYVRKEQFNHAQFSMKKRLNSGWYSKEIRVFKCLRITYNDIILATVEKTLKNELQYLI
jgi:hypothetical protein